MPFRSPDGQWIVDVIRVAFTGDNCDGDQPALGSSHRCDRRRLNPRQDSWSRVPQGSRSDAPEVRP